MSCLPTDKDWKQDFYNNTDCDIYMLINQHQENGVIYPAEFNLQMQQNSD